jgi:16S rRNA (guanine966-N2)-methyltransferase
VRIIGGRSRGLHLAPVGDGDASAHLRPTSDRVREAIFNLLLNGGYGDPVTGARVLDLFAGTGALGLEAVSRGAVSAMLVDDGVVARGLIRRNVDLTRMGDRVTYLRRDATRLGAAAGAFDLVFLDPPYGKSMGEAALASAASGGWLAPDALVVWEENVPPVVPGGLTQLDQRRYGDTIVTILRHD